MLIDCANYNDSSSIRTEIFDYMDDYVTDGQLDYLMLTHCDSDHVYFMDEVLEEYQVDNIFMPDVLAAPTALRRRRRRCATASPRSTGRNSPCSTTRT